MKFQDYKEKQEERKMNDATNVSASKPKKEGAIWRAPKGTTLPTDPTTALDTAFKNLGYISEDGVTNSMSISNETTKDWGGDIVLNSQGEKTDTWKMKLLEALNEDVLKTIFGTENVTKDPESGVISVVSNSDEMEESSYVIDMILKDGRLKRVVLPSAKITSLSDILYKNNLPIAYEITLGLTPDASGNNHYEYIK